MASQSLYRKWRSQTFSDLIGQEPVVRTLLNAVRDGRLAHAYLFCGPRGTGKTSTARLLAKAVNCANPHDGEPCNECISCREITAGHSPDVIEIDAASNTGVDNIRDLRETVSLMGSGGHYKVYVIDEVHMLSTQAFNALLKTLEEPPPHIIFVLATTEAHKVLPTVVSRCQRFDFRRFSMRDLVARLYHVANGENIELEPAAADLLARASQGGMRDALSLLDQAVAFCGDHVDLERTRAMLGLADPSALRRLIECVADQQSADGLYLINEMVTNGADLRQLNAQLAEEWRALVLARAGADVARLMDRADDEAREIIELAGRFSLEELTACARVFARNETPARGLPVPQLALELSFLECLSIRQHGGPVAQITAAPSIGTQPVSAGLRPAPAVMPASQPTNASSGKTGNPAPSPSPSSIVGVSAGRPQTANGETSHTLGAVGATPASPAGGEASPAIEELDLDAIEADAAPPPPPATASSSGKNGSSASSPLPAGREAGGEASHIVEASLANETVGETSPGDIQEWLFRAQNQWELIKQVCKQKRRSVAALLHSARPVMIEAGDVPVLVLQADWKFHLEKLREVESRNAIEWALTQVLQTQMRIKVVPASTNGSNGASGVSGSGGLPPSAPHSSGPNGRGPALSPNGSNALNGNSGRNSNSGSYYDTGNGKPPSSHSPNEEGEQAIGYAAANSGKNGNHVITAFPLASAGVGAQHAAAGLRPAPIGDEASLASVTTVRDASLPYGNGQPQADVVSYPYPEYGASNITPLRPLMSATAPMSAPLASASTTANVKSARSLEAEVRADPVIQQLMRLTGAELADVRPLSDDERQ